MNNRNQIIATQCRYRNWQVLIFLLILCNVTNAQADRTLNTYNGENRITATRSITLVPNFTITAGNDVHIFISGGQGIGYQYDAAGGRISRNAGSAASLAKWVFTGKTRCEQNLNNVNTGNVEREEKDENTASSTYNQLRWVTAGYNTSACPISANWVPTGNKRCQTDGSGNTGYEEIEQRDENPDSPTYNQIRWVRGDYNPESCPRPVCDNSNCSGEGYKCVYGECERGVKICTDSTEMGGGMYENFYHYEWSDGSKSRTYKERTPNACY